FPRAYARLTPGLRLAYARGYILSPLLFLRLRAVALALRGSIRTRLRRDIQFENSCHSNRNLDKYERYTHETKNVRSVVALPGVVAHLSCGPNPHEFAGARTTRISSRSLC